MTKIQSIIDQFIESRNIVNRLISELPQDLWYKIPENTDSNFAWQIGHMMMAQNSHTSTVIYLGVKHEMQYSAEMEEIKRTLRHPIKWLRDAK